MKKALYAVGAVFAVALVWFAYYAISPLFRSIKVDEAAPSAEVNTSRAAPVVGTTGHPASGAARIVQSDGKTYARYENFKTINGPDIYVYLSKDLDAKDFVSLGVVRATEGNINYEIPAGVDPSTYRYVLTWCKQFGVLFNYADFLGT